MIDPYIKISNAAFGYITSSGWKEIITSVNLTIKGGEFVVVEGRNGCGKSTIIKALLGLGAIAKGIAELTIKPDKIGYVPQESSIDNHVPATVFDIMSCQHIDNRQAILAKITNALEVVEMEKFINARFGSLSGGQKRRVLLAKAISTDPLLLILDEPTSNIDINTEKKLEILLKERVTDGKHSVFATTHASQWALSARRWRL